jgi:hypothetical protein
VEVALDQSRAALAAAEVRVAELEEERDEIRALLESFLADNWKRLTDDGAPSMPQYLDSLLGGGSTTGQEVSASEAARQADGSGPGPAAAAAMPSLDDVEELAAALRTGARFETTDSFRRFEPVKTSHIRVSECLASVHDWDSLRNLVRGEVAEQEALEVLFMLLQRSYLRVHPG